MYTVVGTRVTNKRHPGIYCVKKVRVVDGKLKALVYSETEPEQSFVFDFEECELVKRRVKV